MTLTTTARIVHLCPGRACVLCAWLRTHEGDRG